MNNKHRRNQSASFCIRVRRKHSVRWSGRGETGGEKRKKKNGNHGYFQKLSTLYARSPVQKDDFTPNLRVRFNGITLYDNRERVLPVSLYI